MVTEHICWRCTKVYTRKKHLEVHLNKKKPCEIVDLDELQKKEELLEQFPDLEEFNFNYFKKDQNYSTLFCAVRHSGKTTIIKHALYPEIRKQFDLIIFISNSIHNPTYDFVDTSLRFDDQHHGLLEDILKFQKVSKNMLKLALVLDDCISTQKKNSDSLMQMFVRGRNSNISIFLASQAARMINKNSRMNSDCVFIGNNPSIEARESVCTTFLSGLIDLPKNCLTKTEKLEYMDKYLLHHTKDYGFLVVDNRGHKIYKYRLKL